MPTRVWVGGVEGCAAGKGSKCCRRARIAAQHMARYCEPWQSSVCGTVYSGYREPCGWEVRSRGGTVECTRRRWWWMYRFAPFPLRASLSSAALCSSTCKSQVQRLGAAQTVIWVSGRQVEAIACPLVPSTIPGHGWTSRKGLFSNCTLTNTPRGKYQNLKHGTARHGQR